MNTITPSQALQNIYIAARQAPLSADQHQLIADSAKIIDEFLNPQPEVEEGAK